MDPSELELFLDSMHWDVRPLAFTGTPPSFGDQRHNPTYLYGEYLALESQEGAEVWIDTSSIPYRVFISIWLG